MLEAMSPADWVGSTGVALLLFAFALNLFAGLDRASVTYSGLNVLGAGIATYASWMIDYMPFVILEGTWCAVSLLALGLALKRSLAPS